MSLAEYWLNVKQYMTPEELISKHVDDKAMITYLSQYLSAKIRSGAPLRAKRSSNRYMFNNIQFYFAFTIELYDNDNVLMISHESRIIAYGPGIEPVGPIVGSPVSFTVETVAAGRGKMLTSPPQVHN